MTKKPQMKTYIYKKIECILYLTCAPVEEVLLFLKVNFLLCDRSSGAHPESAPVSEPRSSSFVRGICLRIDTFNYRFYIPAMLVDAAIKLEEN